MELNNEIKKKNDTARLLVTVSLSNDAVVLQYQLGMPGASLHKIRNKILLPR